MCNDDDSQPLSKSEKESNDKQPTDGKAQANRKESGFDRYFWEGWLVPGLRRVNRLGLFY